MSSTSNQYSFSSVLSVNPYKETYYKSVSSFLNEETSPQFAKDQFVTSYINTKEFINAQIEISKNIPEEDLYDAIYNKAYDELALDQAVEYRIQYIEIYDTLDEDNRHFNVFIVDPLDITSTFLPIVEQIKYIDTIIPSPLLIRSLYSKNILETSGVHCFVYLQENDAFLVIYNNQEYVYTKSLKYSFKEMYERFCELYGERIDYEDFLRFYSQANLKETRSEYKAYFIKLYKEIFANINDILTYAKRAFEIDKFEHVYIGSNIETVTKLDEMLEVELGIASSEFNFDYGFESTQNYVDQLHALMHLYANLSFDEKYDCNFTQYQRPPKFIKRESGKLIILTAASLVLAFIYPVTYWTLTYAQNLQRDLLKEQYKEVHNKRVTREATLRNRAADKEKALAILEREKQEYISKKHTLIKIHKVKVDYPMKAKHLALLTKDLNKFDVRTDSFGYFEDKNKKYLIINLIASSDKKITKMLAYITKVHEGKLHFTLNKIAYDEEIKRYISELKVKIL
jgi:hypothetical protein